MRSSTITAVALAFSSCGTAALAEMAPRPQPVLIGPVTGDPEKDNVGFIITQRADARETRCSGVPRYTSEAVMVGAPTGDPEKDSFGFLVLPGDGGCAGAAERGETRR